MFFIKSQNNILTFINTRKIIGYNAISDKAYCSDRVIYKKAPK